MCIGRHFVDTNDILSDFKALQDNVAPMQNVIYRQESRKQPETGIQEACADSTKPGAF